MNPLTMRVKPDELERIDYLAKQHRMSRTRYVISMALGEMPAAQSEAMEQLEDHERRLTNIERLVELGASTY